MDIHRLLQTTVDQGASDLHLTVGIAPCLRIDGKMFPIKTEALTDTDIAKLAYSILNDRQQREFEEGNEIDLSFQWKGVSRFRANFFRQHGFIAGVLRKIPNDIPNLGELGVIPSVNELINQTEGLILVTGPTGSGKSTTLASLLDAYNSRHRGHIMTIEDPIEFVHKHKKCIVNQREIGTDTDTYKTALRFVLRQDPDAVLIGEVRDSITMEALLKIAETGHVAFATLHTNNAIQTILRILDFFPPAQHDMIRTQLSFVLKGVISQQLVPRASGRGRALASEVLIPTPAIRNLIRENKIHQIYSNMQLGQGKTGMQTLNQSLFELIKRKIVSIEDGVMRSYDTDELMTMLKDKGLLHRKSRSS